MAGGLAAFAVTQWRRAESHKIAANKARKTADEKARLAVQNERIAEQNARKASESAAAARQQSQLALGTLNSMIFEIQRGVARLAR